jgi:hypothetical protein
MPQTFKDLLVQALTQQMRPVDSHPQTREVTPLTPPEEVQFQQWAKANGIKDVDHPDSRYDYRGYWKDVALQGGNQTKEYADGLHFTDRYKQHGHNTFSTESRYSQGEGDGGNWIGEVFIPQGFKPQSFQDLIRLARKRE